MADTTQCKNCAESFDSSFEFCPHCGQETANNLTVGVLFSNTIRNYFSIDARFFKSFIPLMTKPGVLARRFVDGKRLSYLHPAQFYLFISILFFFIFSFTIKKADNEVSKVFENGFNNEVDFADSSATNLDSLSTEAIDSITIDSLIISSKSFNYQFEVLDSLIASGAPQSEKLKAMGNEDDSGVFATKVYIQLLKLYEQKGGGILKTLYETIPIAMFFLLPIFAMLLKLSYWRRGTFAHHLVFSFYFFTFLFTSFCLLILTNTFFDTPIWIHVLVFLSFIIYLMLALRQFYESRWLGAFFKASFISLIYMLIVLPIAMVGVIFVSFMLY
ncbi:MAG: hypothetical protein ACI8V8_001517 [Chitinophagales bacterium]|jgi:hypothetical protein